jgi:hypothetical protein
MERECAYSRAHVMLPQYWLLKRVPISSAVLIAPMITEAHPGHTAGASWLNGEVVRISTYFYSNLG